MKNVGIQDYGKLAKTYDLMRYTDEGALFIDSLRAEKLGHLLRPSKTMTVLDVATGTGSGLTFLYEKVSMSIGLDGTVEMLNKAKEKILAKNMCNVGLIHANALQIPIAENVFDAVISLNFIHLFTPVQKQRPFLQEMARVVKPGGTVVIEFDNAFLGLFLGLYRKFFVKDIGYNWPWDIYRLNPTMKVSMVVGICLPGTKRLFKTNRTLARIYADLASIFPFKYLANRLLVKYEKI
jgi:ubiquinone/menaquinone biosynthesis C-methylase UbiE